MLTKERVCGLRLHVEVGGGGRRKKRYCPYLRAESIHNKNNEKKNSIISISDIIRHLLDLINRYSRPQQANSHNHRISIKHVYIKE